MAILDITQCSQWSHPYSSSLPRSRGSLGTPLKSRWKQPCLYSLCTLCHMHNTKVYHLCPRQQWLLWTILYVDPLEPNKIRWGMLCQNLEDQRRGSGRQGLLRSLEACSKPLILLFCPLPHLSTWGMLWEVPYCLWFYSYIILMTITRSPASTLITLSKGHLATPFSAFSVFKTQPGRWGGSYP
jgi:hypothetical protein